MKTQVLQVHAEFPDLKDIAMCAKIIRQGGLVVFPTETVYGLAADVSNKNAMQRLREVKRRSEGKPFSRLISQRGLISNYTSFTDPSLYKMIDAYWPGPLTVVVPGKEDDVTMGVRMPDNTIALKLVQEAQCMIAAPSANFEGNPPPSTCEEALRDLDGLVDVAIDGGPARFGLGSSVVDFTKEEPALLREGAITKEDVERTVKKKTVLFVCTGNSCRSVMAHYYLKHKLGNREDVEVNSAGTGVFLQSTASAETVSVLNAEGVDATEHLSQPINTILLKKSDLIFVMTRGHRQQVLERVPQVEKRVYLLKEFTQNLSAPHDMDVPDPIGRSHQEYEHCFALIREAVDKIFGLV